MFCLLPHIVVCHATPSTGSWSPQEVSTSQDFLEEHGLPCFNLHSYFEAELLCVIISKSVFGIVTPSPQKQKCIVLLYIPVVHTFPFLYNCYRKIFRSKTSNYQAGNFCLNETFTLWGIKTILYKLLSHKIFIYGNLCQC